MVVRTSNATSAASVQSAIFFHRLIGASLERFIPITDIRRSAGRFEPLIQSLHHSLLYEQLFYLVTIFVERSEPRGIRGILARELVVIVADVLRGNLDIRPEPQICKRQRTEPGQEVSRKILLRNPVPLEVGLKI